MFSVIVPLRGHMTDCCKYLQVIETDIIQDLMYTAIHIQRSTGKSLHVNLMSVSTSALYSLSTVITVCSSSGTEDITCYV